MAGHSKWANIRHRKGAQDAKRGKIFTKLIKEVTVAVKVGGPDPDANPRLRAAIQNARAQNMPKDKIETAINKGSGAGADDLIETTFEGYGPDGVAIFVECATDNNTRTVANVRSYFNKNNGSLGKDGCLQFIFNHKAVFLLGKEGIDEEELQMELIDAGAEDFEIDDEFITVYGERTDFNTIQVKLQEMGIEPKEGGLQRVPTTSKAISEKHFSTFMKLIDTLEDDDDVQKVYHNAEITDALMESLG
ncbi:MAG: YebC/PmpR family DNA-binding transcriptional regulator [Bradymonadia bacterium]